MKETIERLDKILATQGFGSRRDVKKLIRRGAVAVNGQQVSIPETQLCPQRDTLTVDGKEIHFKQYLYIMLNKPQGVVSSTRDNLDSTVMDILPRELSRQGLFPVGRLDKDTEGLLLITDDGELAHKL
ncbi:MAG: 16S rRNA pseudouridine(516) synthase, partial [Spirochaetaceae bacterium]|nr:16S rRNA pseudouridine(516) synthase [Spirochaetaceae bacterium]